MTTPAAVSASVLLVVGLVLAAVGCSDDGASSRATEDLTLDVTADGVAVVSADGSTSAAMFGTIEGDVVATVESVLGEPVEKGRLQACSPTAQFVTFPGITISLSDGIFVGWSLLPDSVVAITTDDGIGLGSTLADLEASFDVVTLDEPSSLGIEFAADGALFGALDGTGPEARVEDLWAGEICLSG